MHCPGATESATVRTDFVCSLCSSPLQEDMKFRVLGGRIYVILLLDLVVSYFCYTISKQNVSKNGKSHGFFHKSPLKIHQSFKKKKCFQEN